MELMQRNNYTELEENKRQLDHTYQEFNNKTVESDPMVKELEDEIERIKKTFSKKNKQIDKFSKENKEFDSMRKELRNDISLETERNEDLEAEISRILTEINLLSEQLREET